jgi:uncharacterized GH25 family protein
MQKKIFTVFMALPLFICASAGAHEFIVRAAPEAPKKGEVVKVELMAAHTFHESDEMEPVADVQSKWVQGASSGELKIAPNPVAAAKDLSAEFSLPADGTAWLISHRRPQTWSETPDGWFPGDKNTIKDHKVIRTDQYEKFNKFLLNPSPGDSSWKTPVGQTLEIVPAANPAGLRAGDELAVQVLYQGQPLTTPVYATYIGFSKHPDTWAFYAEPEEGQAVVQFTAPGLWLIRAHHQVQKADGESLDLKAILELVVN